MNTNNRNTSLLLRTISVAMSICIIHGFSSATIEVSPKFIFLDASRRSTPMSVKNITNVEQEVWVKYEFAYVGTDDTGGIALISDTTEASVYSAADWVKAYPERFVLGPGESQRLRIVALPPPWLKDGEYWARITVYSKPRKPAYSLVGKKYDIATGLNIAFAVGTEFHYRVRSVTTGVSITDVKPTITDSKINIAMKIARTGNASYWGSRRVRLIDQDGKVVLSSGPKDVAVYKTLSLVEKLDRKGILSGRYTLEIDFVTGKRSDMGDNTLLQSPPVHYSNTLMIP